MAPELELRALIEGSRDAVRRVIADLRERADAAERLRDAEHRAFMAEQREALSALTRRVEDRLATVRDGVDGKDGADGQKGDRGEPGAQGEPGRDGQDGAAGADGRDGQDGAPGKDGIDGKDGAPGIDGRDGADGADGAAGADGKDGEPGAPGEPGRDGIDGKDAYAGEARGLFDPDASYRAMDVVSFNGSEWRAKRDDPGELPGDGWMLSASRGKRGDRGERGPQGADGERGKDGASILAAFVDEDMQLTITRDDGTEVKADLYPLAETVRSAAVRDAERG
ncbi:MAG: hypothetical protein PGN16_08410 [Sphingomonas phyllosphaerae]|uniref:hypothetical protein n=1 Tax=Sphingomonas phyllosphaerae TaxID=257003 RepID=UPI002FF9DE99